MFLGIGRLFHWFSVWKCVIGISFGWLVDYDINVMLLGHLYVVSNCIWLICFVYGILSVKYIVGFWTSTYVLINAVGSRLAWNLENNCCMHGVINMQVDEQENDSLCWIVNMHNCFDMHVVGKVNNSQLMNYVCICLSWVLPWHVHWMTQCWDNKCVIALMMVMDSMLR